MKHWRRCQPQAPFFVLLAMRIDDNCADCVQPIAAAAEQGTVFYLREMPRWAFISGINAWNEAEAGGRWCYPRLPISDDHTTMNNNATQSALVSRMQRQKPRCRWTFLSPICSSPMHHTITQSWYFGEGLCLLFTQPSLTRSSAQWLFVVVRFAAFSTQQVNN